MTKYKSEGAESDSLTLTMRDAAKLLGITEYLARKMARNGELPTIRLGTLVRIPRARLMAMLNGNITTTLKASVKMSTNDTLRWTAVRWT